ncbi:hypothetical protein Taro_037762 [Colocasia esculenta]|uniref:Uncharacterized protein n=1 Tax=Colocasia esculenta TaxID=4460 RepID=A0A843WDT2_COLES|nr:hypothetical protein [Colocasia esculenta]
MRWNRKNAKLDRFSFFGGWGASSQAYPRPISCPSRLAAAGLPISPQLPPVFDPSCMRQKLVPRTVQRPSPTPAVMVRLRIGRSPASERLKSAMGNSSSIYATNSALCLSGKGDEGGKLEGVTLFISCGP